VNRGQRGCCRAMRERVGGAKLKPFGKE